MIERTFDYLNRAWSRGMEEPRQMVKSKRDWGKLSSKVLPIIFSRYKTKFERISNIKIMERYNKGTLSFNFLDELGMVP